MKMQDCDDSTKGIFENDHPTIHLKTCRQESKCSENHIL